MIFSRLPYIVEIAGGLGNQMFQYAFYLKLKTIYKNVKLDTSFYTHTPIHNGYELPHVFGINATYCTDRELINLKDINQHPLHKIKRQLIGYKPNVYYEHSIDYSFKPEVFTFKKPMYLQGCWLSEKYFSDIKESVRDCFMFPEFEEEKNISLADRIKSENSISLHIRRGDYLQNANYQGICGKHYYSNALNYMLTRVQNPYLVVFSDDPDWCANNLEVLDNIPHTLVDWNNSKNSYKDMQLMNLCKHSILANSTFSWWAAWLNEKKKIVIAPKNWFNPFVNKKEDLNLSEWHIL